VFNLSDPDPSALVEFWFYDHPSLKKRMEFARTWKP
jgi:Zn-dependent protease with chaperone function